MNSKVKGNVGELRIASEFVKWGCTVSFPFGDNARYDLVAEINGELKKIQIKYTEDSIESDSFRCKCESSTYHTNNKGCQTYINDVDYIALYIDKIDTCCLIPIEAIGKKRNFYIRNSIPKNNQTKGIHFVWDYTFEKILTS